MLSRTRSHSAHSYARSRVYDLRNYTEESNKWGPFKHDGVCGIDWEKVEAIMIVLAYNMQLFSERANCWFPMVWNTAFEGATPYSYMPIEKHVDFEAFYSRIENIPAPKINVQLDSPLESMDPYGVTGMWRRVSLQPRLKKKKSVANLDRSFASLTIATSTHSISPICHTRIWNVTL